MAQVAACRASQHSFPAISIGTSSLNCNLKPRKWTHQTVILGGIPKLQAVSSATPSSNDKDSRPADMVTYSANITTDTPFYEPPGASFSEYLKDRPRIFKAMFPDPFRSRRLNDEEWRIEMLPLQFLFASVNPVVVMRLRSKSNGEDYPPSVPLNVGRILELQATRWELQGLDALTMPPTFSLSVQGLLYSERKSNIQQAHLKGHLELSISLVLPTLLALLPKDVVRATAELVLKRLIERMKQDVDGGLLADFRRFGRERLVKQGDAAA